MRDSLRRPLSLNPCLLNKYRGFFGGVSKIDKYLKRYVGEYVCALSPFSAKIHVFLRPKVNTQKLMSIAMCRFKGRFWTKIPKSTVNVAFLLIYLRKNKYPIPGNDSKTTDKYRHVRAIPKQLVQFVRGVDAQWVYDFPRYLSRKSGHIPTKTRNRDLLGVWVYVCEL